ncbi:MAG: TetR/AcrR family transcriptional regulator [Cyclobacteriaceae bacterium]
MKEKIVEVAESLFMRLGIRSVTMDDVARELSISKKTLYQSFAHKDELVTAVARLHMDREIEQFTSIAKDAENAIDELHRIAYCMRQNILKMNPSTLYDIQKYHKTAWGMFQDFKTDFIKTNIKHNLNRGITEGFYRPEINTEIIAQFRIEQVEMMFDGQTFASSQFDFVEVQMQLFDHFVHGLLTHDGRALYKNFQQVDLNISHS